ncbi:MAG: hypothetical protein R3E89_11005 [Thiolinea sp.]
MQPKDDDDGMRWIENPARGPKLTLRKLKEVEKRSWWCRWSAAPIMCRAPAGLF